MTAMRQHPPIVVGVDGSPTSGPALRWAIREAATRGVPIQLVSAWNPSYDIDTLGLATRVVGGPLPLHPGRGTRRHRRR